MKSFLIITTVFILINVQFNLVKCQFKSLGFLNDGLGTSFDPLKNKAYKMLAIYNEMHDFCPVILLLKSLKASEHPLTKLLPAVAPVGVEEVPVALETAKIPTGYNNQDYTQVAPVQTFVPNQGNLLGFLNPTGVQRASKRNTASLNNQETTTTSRFDTRETTETTLPASHTSSAVPLFNGNNNFQSK